MGFASEVERKFPWGFLGFVAAIAFGLFGVYAVFFYAKVPDPRFEVLASGPVLSIRENVQGLDVMLSGRSLRQSHQSLSVLTVRVVNRGGLAIRPGDFDPLDLPTLHIRNGTLLRAEPLGGSDTYLRKVVDEATSTATSLSLQPFILDPGRFVTFKLLVIHPDSREPTVEASGKIAGVRQIPVVIVPDGSASPSIWATAFSGDPLTQLIRIIAYGVAVVLVLVGLAFLADQISTVASRRRAQVEWQKARVRADDFLRAQNPKTRRALEPIARRLSEPSEMPPYLYDMLFESAARYDLSPHEREAEVLRAVARIDSNTNVEFFERNPEARAALQDLLHLYMSAAREPWALYEAQRTV